MPGVRFGLPGPREDTCGRASWLHFFSLTDSDNDRSSRTLGVLCTINSGYLVKHGPCNHLEKLLGVVRGALPTVFQCFALVLRCVRSSINEEWGLIAPTTKCIQENVALARPLFPSHIRDDGGEALRRQAI